jgi:hypothetical protein
LPPPQLTVHLPPGDDGVEGRKHYASLVDNTWPRLLPAVPHQIIVYEEDSDSEDEEVLMKEDLGLSDAMERAEMLMEENGGDDANEKKENGNGNNENNSDKTTTANKMKFEIHLLCVGEEDILANGAETVGTEAAEAALQEALSGGDSVPTPSTLLSNCIYHVVGTRGGDDGADHDELHEGVDDEVVVADDRDVEVTICANKTAWLTLDCVIAAFVDPLTAEKGHMISMSTPLVNYSNTVTWERKWNWYWDEQKKEKENEVSDEVDTITENSSAPLVLPTAPGQWKRLARQWQPNDVLFFPIPSDTAIEDEEKKEDDEKKEEEEKKEDATVTVILSNHLSLPSDYSSSKSKIVLKRLDDQSTTVLHTPTNKSIEMIVNFGKEKKSRMFEIINDTPSGSEYFYCHYYCC